MDYQGDTNITEEGSKILSTSSLDKLEKLNICTYSFI